MSALGRNRLALIVVAAVAIAGASAAALILTGGSDSPDDTEPGDRTGPFVSVGDLPGDGWTSADTALQQASTSGVELASSAPSFPECESLRVLERALAGADGSFVAGETRTAERRDGDRLVASLTHTRLEFSDATALQAAITEMDAAVAAPDFALCLERAAATSGLQAAVAPSEPAAAPPAGGSAHAFTYTVAAGDGAERMVQHLYWWPEQTTLVTLVIATWDGEQDVPGMLDSAVGAAQ